MSKLRNNTTIEAGLLLMLMSAFIHMGVLALHFLITFDASPFNFFRIIGLDLFFPVFVSSVIGNYVAAALVVILFLGLYRYVHRIKKSIGIK
jgi:hypothetical protein